MSDANLDKLHAVYEEREKHIAAIIQIVLSRFKRLAIHSSDRVVVGELENARKDLLLCLEKIYGDTGIEEFLRFEKAANSQFN